MPMSSPSGVRRPFVVMAKPAGSACNMRCAYCYYLHNPASSPGGVMSPETLESLIRTTIAASPGPVVSFVWHGGEPMLAGLDFYREAVRLQKQMLPEGWECWNNLQTNGLALDDAWCCFLAEEHFDVGVSLDGTAPVHDAFRPDAAGHATYDRIAANIRLLQSHGIQPDLLCTVNAQTAENGRLVYSTLRDLGTGWIQFIPVVIRNPDGTLAEPSVSPRAYGEFLKDVFAQWFYHDLDKAEIQLFSETARMLSGGEASLCWLRETCGDAPVVEKDGSVYACDHFVRAEYRRGSLLDTPFEQLINSPEQLAFGQQKKDGLTAACRNCPWLSLCHGGCPKDRFALSPDGEAGQYALCEGLKMYFDYAVPRLRRAMALSAQGTDRSRVMQLLIQEERKQFQGVSRNDPCPCGCGKKFKQCCQKRVP